MYINFNFKKLIQCNWCSKKYWKYKNYLKINNFCSTKCYGKWQSKNRVGINSFTYNKIKIKCNYCGSILYRNNARFKNKHQFCNQQCYGRWLSKNKKGPNSIYYKRINVFCKSCKKILKITKSKIARNKYNFCNPKCYHSYYKNKKSPFYIHGKSIEPYLLEFKYIKESIRKRDNYKCKLCGISQQKYLILRNQKLHVHHIDYDKNHADPNRLITLCGNCNVKVNYNRDYYFAYFNYILNRDYRH